MSLYQYLNRMYLQVHQKHKKQKEGADLYGFYKCGSNG